MLFNESFWVAFSILLFLGIIFKYLKQPLNKFFIHRATAIEHRLDEVIALSNEAEKLLQEQLMLYKSSTKEAEEMLVLAEAEIVCMQVNAKKELEVKLASKNMSVLEKIHTNEAKLLEKLRLSCLQLAIEASIKIIQTQDLDKINAKLIDESMEMVAAKFS